MILQAFIKAMGDDAWSEYTISVPDDTPLHLQTLIARGLFFDHDWTRDYTVSKITAHHDVALGES